MSDKRMPLRGISHPITYQLSPMGCHLLLITYHLSPVTYHLSPATPSHYHRLMMNGDTLNGHSIPVGEFLSQAPEELFLEVLAGEKGLATRKLTAPRIQKLGLALAGFSHYVHPGRLQIVGQSEIW